MCVCCKYLRMLIWLLHSHNCELFSRLEMKNTSLIIRTISIQWDRWFCAILPPFLLHFLYNTFCVMEFVCRNEMLGSVLVVPCWVLRIAIPHEEWGIKEFHDKEFLTRKTDKENKELNSIKNDIVWLDFSFWKEKKGKIWYLKNINA